MDDDAAAAGPSGRDQSGAASMPFATQGDDFLDVGGSDFELLKRALLNERMAPDILQYKEDLVQRIQEGLERQETALLDMENRKEYDLVHQVLAYERDRVRYLLKSYLRARLDKIQKYAGDVLDSAEVRDRLSGDEARFALQYFVALGRNLKASVLDDLPTQYQSLVKRYEGEAHKSLLDTPDLNAYVFCEVLTDCGQVPDGPDGQTAEMRAGDMMVVKYTTVDKLVRTGQVALL